MTKRPFRADEERRIHALNLAVAAADRNPFRRDLEAGDFARRIILDAVLFEDYLATSGVPAEPKRVMANPDDEPTTVQSARTSDAATEDREGP